MYRMFLDDERFSPNSNRVRVWINRVVEHIVDRYPTLTGLANTFWPRHKGDWIVVRSVEEAIAWVQHNTFPDFISFDNDLGKDQREGWEFAHWLIDYDLNTGRMPEKFDFYVHSQNPVAAENIRSKLNSYLRFKMYNAE